MNNAVFYDNRYYLLPEEFPSFETFKKDLCGKVLPATYQMVALRENHNVRNRSVIKGLSMAPYFLSGYNDSPESVTIASVEDVYPAFVEVLDQTEYNARLREVIERVCPGCLRYKPLSPRVQSLNGHFEEVSLDGTCLFRQEYKPAPRVFRDNLFSFGGFFHHFNYASNSCKEMQDNLKWLYVRYAEASLNDEYGCKTLMLTCRKNELLAPIVTDAISKYVDKVSQATYHIQQSKPFAFSEKMISEFLSDENIENYRKECKKYGVALAVIEYDPQAAEQIRCSVKALCEGFWMFSLLQTDGKDYYLVADTATTLKELRYRTPLLQAYNTTVSVYDQYRNSSYRVSFVMERTDL